MRAAVDVPLDVYVEAPTISAASCAPRGSRADSRRGARLRQVRAAERARRYSAGTHIEATTVALSRERVRRARLGLELLARSGYEPVSSELGAPGLAVPVSPNEPKRADGPSVHVVHRPVGRSAARPTSPRWPAGFDGVELACWGTTSRSTARDSGYCEGGVQAARSATGLACCAIAAHLVGQAVCDLIDERHQRSCRRTSGATASPRACAHGPPSGSRRRPRRRASWRDAVSTASPARRSGISFYSFPPKVRRRSSAATRTSRSAGARSSTCSTGRCAVRAGGASDGDRLRLRDHAQDAERDQEPRAARIILDPGRFAPSEARRRRSSHRSPTNASTTSTSRTRSTAERPHAPSSVHLDFGKSARLGLRLTRPGTSASRLLPRPEPHRFPRPVSMEWRDNGMDRDWGAPDALRVRASDDCAPSGVAFDAAIQKAEG